MLSFVGRVGMVLGVELAVVGECCDGAGRDRKCELTHPRLVGIADHGQRTCDCHAVPERLVESGEWVGDRFAIDRQSIDPSIGQSGFVSPTVLDRQRLGQEISQVEDSGADATALPIHERDGSIVGVEQQVVGPQVAVDERRW